MTLWRRCTWQPSAQYRLFGLRWLDTAFSFQEAESERTAGYDEIESRVGPQPSKIKRAGLAARPVKECRSLIPCEYLPAGALRQQRRRRVAGPQGLRRA